MVTTPVLDLTFSPSSPFHTPCRVCVCVCARVHAQGKAAINHLSSQAKTEKKLGREKEAACVKLLNSSRSGWKDSPTWSYLLNVAVYWAFSTLQGELHATQLYFLYACHSVLQNGNIH